MRQTLGLQAATDPRTKTDPRCASDGPYHPCQLIPKTPIFHVVRKYGQTVLMFAGFGCALYSLLSGFAPPLLRSACELGKGAGVNPNSAQRGGAIFRRISKGGKVQAGAISVNAIYQIVRQYSAGIGVAIDMRTGSVAFE